MLDIFVIEFPKCRLINPAKIEIGKLSKKILSRVVEDVRAKTKLKLWKNTDSVVNWYENLSDKKNLKFIQYDISEYYGNISKVLFTEAVDWATQFTNIDEKERKVIFESKQSMLFDGSDWWKRKGDDDFLIQIGSWDGAESTDLVGLYILSKLSKLDKNIDVGLYHDDGLISSKLTNRQTENIKKKITNIFAQYGLKLEIIANQKIVNFLDVTLDLNKELLYTYTSSL